MDESHTAAEIRGAMNCMVQGWLIKQSELTVGSWSLTVGPIWSRQAVMPALLVFAVWHTIYI